MPLTLPSASTEIIRQGGSTAAGIDLATIWGCCPNNADMTPRLWYDGNALESYHGPGPLLDEASLYIRITDLPVLVVPLPIDEPGVIGTQIQTETGTANASVTVGANGSLLRVDGALRVDAGGTVGVDQIRLGYSLDDGNIWTSVRLGMATTYEIPRTGHIIELSEGTLVTGEEILTWTSTAPTPADADIATAREKLAAQGKQSRAWYLSREVETEQQLSAYRTAVATYDATDKRPLQAYAGLRRAYNRSGYKAQLSQIRNWMQGSPSITFTQGAGPPADDITRATGSFVADGFADWSTVPDWIFVAGASEAGNNGPWQLASAGVTKLDTTTAGALTTDTDATGVTIYAAPGLEFVDGGGSPDTLLRDPGRGSWRDDGFRAGDTMVITGTASNDGSYPIVSVTDSAITVATGSFAAEEISSWGVSITASVLYAVDVAALDAAFATVTDDEHTELSYGQLWNTSPTTGARLRYPVALADMCRSFLRDLSETTWEQGYGSLARPVEGWGMTDRNGQPFEYDERMTRAALPAGFTCATTHPEVGETVPYIGRSVTRYGLDAALLQPANARVTNLARRIVQIETKAFTGKKLPKRPPDALGRRTLTSKSLASLETGVNAELGKQLLGTSRRGVEARVSAVSWVASKTDDFGVPNPVLNGKLTVDTQAAIVTVNTAVEVV